MKLTTPVAVCIWPEPAPNRPHVGAYPHYLLEVLDHAGLCYRRVEPDALADALPSTGVLVTVGEAEPDKMTHDALSAWVRAGGAWLAIGGTGGAPDLLGVEPAEPGFNMFGGRGRSVPLGEGYLAPAEARHPVLAPLSRPLHYFNGSALTATTGRTLASILDAHQRRLPHAGLVEHEPGDGCTLVIAPDVAGSIVRIQQGVAITRDGIGPSDGSAPVCDGVLKSDDGGVLDWSFDRRPLPGVDGCTAFLEPIADQWRELVLRGILHLAHRRGVAVPMLWYWPDNADAIAHLSHDTDGNHPDRGRALLDLVNELGIRSTWCVIEPGYDRSFIDELRQAGHELAMHYDAVSEGKRWSQAQFNEQWAFLRALFGVERITTNKNHYLRWEGDTDLFQWCAAAGIELDQSKGPSKTGVAGFNFGSCHAWFPLDPAGRPIDVLELATQTQDLEVFAPRQLGDALVDAAARHHGVLHVLFHPFHMEKAEVRDALRHVAATVRQRGLPWWTAARINRWERARRRLGFTRFEQSAGRASVRLRAGESLPGATLLWMLPGPGADAGQPVQRWGFPGQAVTIDLDTGTDRDIDASWSMPARAAT